LGWGTTVLDCFGILFSESLPMHIVESPNARCKHSSALGMLVLRTSVLECTGMFAISLLSSVLSALAFATTNSPAGDNLRLT